MENDDRSILIIGAGIGGLSLGCYAQMNGYRARIYEMHSAAGGLCTAHARGGYVFDRCVQNLAGTAPSSAQHTLWRELGVVPAVRMGAFKELAVIDRPGGGEPFIVHANLERLEADMRRLFPADRDAIDSLFVDVRRLARLDPGFLASATPIDRAKALASYPMLAAIAGTTIEAYARKFRDPLLRQALPRIVHGWQSQPAFMLLLYLARLHEGDLGYAVGGSAAISRALERRFLELGGEIEFWSQVESIVVKDDRALGVTFSDGAEEHADIVVSNAYGPTTIFDMLGGRYTSRVIANHYSTPQDRLEIGVQVSMGVARDLSNEPHAIMLPLERPVSIDGQPRDWLHVQTFSHDPSMAPPGKGVLTVTFSSSWNRWEKLAQDTAEYKAEQRRIASAVIELLSKRFPGLRKQVEVCSVATPISMRRRTGNGRWHHFGPGEMARALLMGHKTSETLPGLANFYMVGQWAGLPGVAMVASMARDVMRRICQRDGRRFAAAPLTSAA